MDSLGNDVKIKNEPKTELELYAEIAKPLSHLLKNNVPFIWGNSEEKSFQDLERKAYHGARAYFSGFFETFYRNDRDMRSEVFFRKDP